MQSIQIAAVHISEAFNVLHWAACQNATGAVLAERARLAVEELDQARAILIALAEGARGRAPADEPPPAPAGAG